MKNGRVHGGFLQGQGCPSWEPHSTETQLSSGPNSSADLQCFCKSALTCSSLLPPHSPKYFHLDAHFHDLQRWRVSIKYEHDYINLKVAWGIAQKSNLVRMCSGPSFGNARRCLGWNRCPGELPFPPSLPTHVLPSSLAGSTGAD